VLLDMTDLIRPSEAAGILGITTRTLRTLTAAGVAPQPIRMGQNGVRYRESQILELARTYEPERPGPKPKPRHPFERRASS
jgi:predicted DNA-binding transcriptional regulator AlpA